MLKPRITDEQEQALNANHGLVQAQGAGGDVILMRTDILLDWFGFTREALRQQLDPALKQADDGQLTEWDLNAFLTEMHRKQDAKTD